MFNFLEVFRKNYYRNKGQQLLLKGKPEKAFPYLEKALILDNSPHNLFNLALSLLAMQRYEAAEAYLVITVTEAPGNALAVLTLADIYMQKREWDKAQEILVNLCSEYPANTHYKKYLNLISDPKAREKYIRAKELLNRAKSHIDAKNIDEALKDLLQAEKYDTENPYIQSNLGSFYLNLKKDPKTAFQHFHKAYQLSPENRAFKENMEAVRKLITK